MGTLLRAGAAAVAIAGGVLASAWSTFSLVVASAATVTALIMGGTWSPLVGYGPQAQTDEFVSTYLDIISHNYLQGATGIDPDQMNKVAVYTPEQFVPFTAGDMTFDQSVAVGATNLSACLSSGSSCPRNLAFGTPEAGPTVVFGYSQSTRIAVIVKRSLIDYYEYNDWQGAPDVSFVLAADVNRPNGGILARFTGLSIPFLGVTADGPAPTNSCDSAGVCHLSTIDISFQYDGFSDFPSHPLNVLADLNAVLGIAYEHGYYPFYDPFTLATTIDQGVYGDTRYYLMPATTVPILVPLQGILPASWITALDMPMRTVIEMGYSRDISPGEPVSAQWLRFSPLRDVITVAIAIATGIDDAIAQKTGDASNRPLGTTPVSGPFGVPEFSFADWWVSRHSALVSTAPAVAAPSARSLPAVDTMSLVGTPGASAPPQGGDDQHRADGTPSVTQPGRDVTGPETGGGMPNANQDPDPGPNPRTRTAAGGRARTRARRRPRARRRT